MSTVPSYCCRDLLRAHRPWPGDGPAVLRYRDDGTWALEGWADSNDAAGIEYCPYCGLELRWLAAWGQWAEHQQRIRERP